MTDIESLSLFIKEEYDSVSASASEGGDTAGSYGTHLRISYANRRFSILTRCGTNQGRASGDLPQNDGPGIDGPSLDGAYKVWSKQGGADMFEPLFWAAADELAAKAVYAKSLPYAAAYAAYAAYAADGGREAITAYIKAHATWVADLT